VSKLERNPPGGAKGNRAIEQYGIDMEQAISRNPLQGIMWATDI
jgi:hypothetical protein